MKTKRYEELNSLWKTSPIGAIVDAYKSGGNEAAYDAITRLPQQYDVDTFMGDMSSAYSVLEDLKNTYERIVADSLRDLSEYADYMEKIDAEDAEAYECIYMLDFLGSSMFDLLNEKR